MGKDIRAGQESANTTAVSRHTPGPWGVRADRQYFNVNAADGSLVVGEEGFYRMDGEDEANARLVAAAPELLEALYAILEGMEVSGGWEGDDELFDRGMAAYRKATGETR